MVVWSETITPIESGGNLRRRVVHQAQRSCRQRVLNPVRGNFASIFSTLLYSSHHKNAVWLQRLPSELLSYHSIFKKRHM